MGHPAYRWPMPSNSSRLDDLVARADEWLQVGEIPDYPQALNGLQFSNGGTVTRIAAAVDACLPVIKAAVARGADLLVVHHGLFWSGAQRVTGAVYEKTRLAVQHGLAIYSAHLPLDVHPDLGNNALLARALGLTEVEPFFAWKGIQLGLQAASGLPLSELESRLRTATGSLVHVCPGGPDPVRRIGIVTGGAGAEVAQAAREGVDTFITGEGPHWSYTLAEELGVNLLYGGHYATETFGVKALAARLAVEFDVPWEFIDHPTGL